MAQDKVREDLRKELGARIRAARKQAGLTREQAAATVGVRFGTIEAWEQGRSWPRDSHVAAIRDKLGVEVDDLLQALFAPPAQPEGRTLAERVADLEAQVAELRRQIGQPRV